MLYPGYVCSYNVVLFVVGEQKAGRTSDGFIVDWGVETALFEITPQSVTHRYSARGHNYVETFGRVDVWE